MKVHLFAVGQEIQYVCYGSDPTYADVGRPQFLVISAKVTFVKGRAFKVEGDESQHDAAHFEARTVLKGELTEEIIRGMAAEYARKYEFQSQASIWRPGAVSQASLDKMAAVAQQYRIGQYDIIAK